MADTPTPQAPCAGHGHVLGAWAWRSEPEGGGGAAAERARWGGAGCLRACGVSLVGRGTLLCCLLALGPNPDNSRTVGGATTDRARWGGAGCLGACGVNLVGAGRCGVASQSWGKPEDGWRCGGRTRTMGRGRVPSGVRREPRWARDVAVLLASLGQAWSCVCFVVKFFVRKN